MNSLPFDIQENIYRRLCPKERVKMKLVFSKNDTVIGKPNIDKKLAVVTNYIAKNKKQILKKTKKISQAFILFFNDNQDDHYIKKLGLEIGIDFGIEKKNDLLLNDIRKNKINKNIKIYSYIEPSYEYKQLLLNTISKSSTVETFKIIYNFEMIKSIFNDNNDNITTLYSEKYSVYIEMFIFGLVNYNNKDLLEYISTNNEYNNWFKIGKTYLQLPFVGKLFSQNVDKIKLLINFCELSENTIQEILNEAEENLYTDTALLLLKHIKTNDNIEDNINDD
jgi:hypothetical protein